MAYVPDDAIDDSFQLTPTAFRLYCFICRRRNHKTGNAWIKPKVASNLLGVSPSQIYRALAELTAAKWIITNNETVVPIYGTFTPADRRPKNQPDDTPETVAPVRQSVAPMRKSVAPVRKHSYISSNKLNQPFNPEEQKTQPRRGWFCQKCHNTGKIYREFSSEWRRCGFCDIEPQEEQ